MLYIDESAVSGLVGNDVSGRKDSGLLDMI